jgi:hypothetical protein
MPKTFILRYLWWSQIKSLHRYLNIQPKSELSSAASNTQATKTKHKQTLLTKCDRKSAWYYWQLKFLL